MTVPFIPGLELARQFYAEAVRPLLAEALPHRPHAAALLGPGSEVLGLDTERSRDHDWGPRLQVFLTAEDAAGHAQRLTGLLSQRLPASFHGWPTRFTVTREPGRPAHHHVKLAELGTWLSSRLGFDPSRDVTLLDWLATPTQRLAEVTAGEVFHDGLGTLTQARARLAWYPHDVWLWLLACQWRRIAQEEPFVGRSGEAGDELGSAVVTSRLVRDLMRLVLLMARRYPPYGKWLGTAFSRLPAATALQPMLAGALWATDWRSRERHLGDAYQAAADLHNQLEVTEPVDTNVRGFHDRPYRVLDAGRFTTALQHAITDPKVGHLPMTGAVDQFVDSTDALIDLGLLRATVAAQLHRTGQH